MIRAVVPSVCYKPEGIMTKNTWVIAVGDLTCITHPGVYLVMEVKFIRALIFD